MELLEDRVVPSTVTWTNAAGGDWDTASNWDANRVPIAADDAVVNMANITVSHASSASDFVNSVTCQATLSITGGSLSLANTSTINALIILSAGTLTGSGNVIVTGPFTWGAVDTGGGTLQGPAGSTLTAQGGMTSQGNGGRIDTLDGRTLYNAVNATATLLSGGIRLSNGAAFYNQGTLLDQTTDHYGLSAQNDGTATAFYNQGIYTKTGNSETDWGLNTNNNSGTVNVQAGTLVVSFGTSSGSFIGASGTTLYFDGQTLTGPVSGDQVMFADTNTVAGTYQANGTTVHVGFSSTVVTFTGTIGTNQDHTIGDLTVQRNSYGAGTATFSPANPTTLTLRNLNLQGGILNGSDSFVVSGLFTWGAVDTGGGTLQGPAGSTLTAQGGMTSQGNGGRIDTLDGRTLYNAVNATATLLSGGIRLSNGAAFYNQGTLLDQTTDHYGLSAQNDGTATAFYNQGIYTKTGNSETDWGLNTNNNSGTVNVQAGTLNIGYYVQTGGSTNLFGGTLASGNPIMINGGALSGSGTINASVTSAGQVNPGGLGAVGVITIKGNYTQTAIGALNIDIAGLTAGTQYDQLAVSGTVSLAGSLNVTLLNSFVPVPGNSFLVLNNTGGGGVTGSFNEPSPFQAGYGVYQLGYQGGVTLTYVDTIPNGLTVTQSASSINEGSSLAINGSFNDPDPGQTHMVLINWGDSSPNTTLNLAAGVLTYSASHPYLDNPAGQPNGSFPISVSVTDSLGYSTTVAASVQVNNVAPTVGAITAPVAPQSISTTINASANFTDPGVLDTHTAVWNWGDGMTSAGTVTESSGSGSVTGSHLYAVDGVFTITLSVTDKDGGAGTSLFQYEVIYNPNAGFVTGGGWINSPAGAYVPNPALTGKANFGFNSKYKPGQSVPSGDTAFQFEVGNLNFHSTSYDWLTISGNRAQYQGSGMINGTGNYGFILTATDGDLLGNQTNPDTFRIRIWDNKQGNGQSPNGLIYDNQPNAGIYNDPTGSVLGGGEIVIHKSNQTAAGGPGAHPGIGPQLTMEQLRPVVTEAIARWQEAGATPEQLSLLTPLTYQIVSLPPGILAMTGPGTIWVSPDADGYGWFIDPSPTDDGAFTRMPASRAQNRMDLLSVIAHELGHVVLGMDESAQANDVMTEALQPGVRRLPTPYDLALEPSAAWASSHSSNGLKKQVLTADGMSVLLLDGLFSSGLETRHSWGVPQAPLVQALSPSPVAIPLVAREGASAMPNWQPLIATGLVHRGSFHDPMRSWVEISPDDGLVAQLARDRVG